MRLWGTADRATEVLHHCQPWLPVEHLIIYNSSNTDETAVQKMITEGQRVLSAIPGVREVFTGTAIKADASYRYTWLVRFCHPAVIDSYREHPDHVAFADQHFRPIAGDRISIDYRSSSQGHEK
jgi:fructose-bisphosphate aldolase class II